MSNDNQITESGSQKRYCRFHVKCKKNQDPDHKENFICVYQKDCYHGLTCSKLNDEEHSTYFSHKQSGGLKKDPPITPTVLKKVKDKKIVKRVDRPATNSTKPVSKKSDKFNKTSPFIAQVEFELTAYGNKRNLKINGEYETRIFKEVDNEKVVTLITRSIMNRYCRTGIYTSSNLELKVKVEGKLISGNVNTRPVEEPVAVQH